MIAMKTNRHAQNTDWPAPELIRYAMSLPGITTTIVGLDSMAHLEENIAMASRFTPMKRDEMIAFSEKVRSDLAPFGQAPWENPAYQDGRFGNLWA